MGLYPLLGGDLYSWLAADFDGQAAMLSAGRPPLSTALPREAMAVRGHMDLAGYDRLFPSQDVLPSGGVGNLIAAPLLPLRGPID